MHAPRWLMGFVYSLTLSVWAQEPAANPNSPAYRAAADQRHDLYFQAVSLGGRPTDDLVCQVDFRGTRQWYGQIRYGSSDSLRIAVVVDERPDGVDLYLDRHRTRELDKENLVPGNGPDWVVELDTQLGHEANESARRTVLFRWGKITKALGVATLGGIDGETVADSRSISVRRLDGNGNGLFNDFSDVVMLDFDGDRQFDPIREQFLYRPIVSVGSTRMRVRSHPLSGDYQLAPIGDVGSVSLKLPAGLSRVQEFSASLVSEEGVAVIVTGADRAHEAPAGSYYVETLQLVLIDEKARRWSYTFTRPYGAQRPESQAIVVQANQITTVEPLAETQFLIEQTAPAGKVKPGRLVELQPRWLAACGLQINAVTITDGAKSTSQPMAKVQLVTATGDGVASQSCGFY